MSETKTVTCARCQRDKNRVRLVPYPLNEVSNLCEVCTLALLVQQECGEINWKPGKQKREIGEEARLRKRTHEIQERADKEIARLNKELEEKDILLGIYQDEIKVGEEWFWNIAQISERPFGLSNANALKIGHLLRQLKIIEMQRDEARRMVVEAEVDLLVLEGNPLLAHIEVAQKHGWEYLYEDDQCSK